MSYICRSCALRAQRSATLTVRNEVQRRTFTQSNTQQKHATGSVPSFGTSSSPDLTTTLETLRTSHFLPAYLNNRQRNLIYRQKYKNELEYNPATATIGNEEFRLQHVDRIHDVPPQRPLVQKALSLIRSTGEWKHLPAVLEGLVAADTELPTYVLEKSIRQATEADKFSAIMWCLRKPDATGMSLGEAGILHWVLRSLRRVAVRGDWGEEATAKAIRSADQVALMLEEECETKPRIRSSLGSPVVIGAWLELNAVNAVKHKGGKDTDGAVKKYAVRLTSRLDGFEYPQQPIDAKGPQKEFYSIFPIWNGLRLARRILGSQMPNEPVATAHMNSISARLKEITQTWQGQGPLAEDGYADLALKAYNEATKE